MVRNVIILSLQTHLYSNFLLMIERPYTTVGLEFV